ncbi:MAG: hypothetical protein Q7S27_05085 [Nanoarchaeota archaeon]|nr:hypothetical protein [Nanoarchaeota archaeon]
MQLDLIKEIVSNIIGKVGEQIVNILYKKKNVNEFLIAKKLNLTINQTRNLLYRLSDKGLVHFIRKKDSKKGGWYTYFWTLNEKKALELLKNQKTSKIIELQQELEKRKGERYYFCPASALEYNEEQALENNFISPETGEVLQLKNNKQEVDRLEIEISKIKLLVEEVSVELSQIEKKGEKDKERRLKAEVKKKETERKEKREKLKKLRAKEAKKVSKNKVKKVSKKSKKK